MINDLQEIYQALQDQAIRATERMNHALSRNDMLAYDNERDNISGLDRASQLTLGILEVITHQPEDDIPQRTGEVITTMWFSVPDDFGKDSEESAE